MELFEHTLKKDRGNSVITDGSQYNKSVGSQVEFWILLLCTKDIIALLSFLRTLLANSDQLKFGSNKCFQDFKADLA